LKKFKRVTFVIAAAVALAAAFAQGATATPTKTSACTGCHGGVNVPVTATLVSVTSAAAVYNLSAPTATVISWFSGTTKISYIRATSTQISVAPGKTYTIYAVKGPLTSDGIGQTSVSPVAPVADTVAPVTTSNAGTAYTGTASIALTAADNAGGSGVAHTYYILDAGAQLEGTAITVTTPGAHTLTFWSVDTAGNVELQKTAAFTVTALDLTAPVTTSNAVASYISTAAITFAATDAGGSGVAHTYYKLDGGVQIESLSVVTSVLGTHTVEFWSVDGAGNTETPHKTATFSVVAPADKTAPVTTSDALASYVGTATIMLVATDAGGSAVAHTYYKLDAGAQVESRTVVVSSVGTHTVEFWSVDGAANTETPHKTATFKITAPVGNDKIAPITTSNAKSYYTATATVVFSSKDNTGGAGVSATYYVLDGAARAAGASVTVGAAGPHTLEFWSIDKAANEELPHKTASFVVDGLAPTTTSNAAQFYAGPATVTLTADDGPLGSGVSATSFRLDGAVAASGTVVTATSAGTHTIEFWSADKAGNTETPHKTATFIIDTAAPTTTSDAASTYTAAATIALSATDGPGSGVAHTYYRLDGGAQAEGSAVSVSAGGAHTLEFWSVDKAGNTETPHKSASFTIDSAAPVTTSDATALYTLSATIQLSATDVGSGVALTHYSLDGAAPVVGTAIAVSTLGTHTVEFWSTDNYGNEETPHKSVTLRVTPVPSKVTVVRTPAVGRITKHRRHGVARYTLSARLRGSNGTALPGIKAELQMRDTSADPWISVYTRTSNSHGAVSKAFEKHRKYTACYRWYVPATEANLAATTAPTKVVVK
jgi:hypothetical protein